jgi:uncharacterized protein YfdQ (DUF2303 family)
MDSDNIQTLRDIASALNNPRTPTTERDVLILPEGYCAQSVETLIEKYLTNPRRVKASVKLQHLGSFIDYVVAFALNNQTRIFSATDGSLVAVIDYHSANKGANPDPHWGEHRAHYAPVITPEWQRWIERNKKRMEQTQFAEFLEENQALIVDPSGADLLEMVQTLEGKNHIDYNSAIRLTNGKMKLDYSEQVELKGVVNSVKGAVEFPTILTAGLVPFDGGNAYRVSCRLRYRIESRKLTFYYEIIDPHLVLKTAIAEITDLVTDKTGIAPLTGTP